MLILRYLKSCFYFSHPKSWNLDRMYNCRKMIWRECQMLIFLRRLYQSVFGFPFVMGMTKLCCQRRLKNLTVKHAQTREVRKCLTCPICLCYYDLVWLLSSPKHSFKLVFFLVKCHVSVVCIQDRFASKTGHKHDVPNLEILHHSWNKKPWLLNIGEYTL